VTRTTRRMARPAELRGAVDRFATGVVVVAAGRGRPRWVTAAAFNSLSLDPPLLLWCVAQRTVADLALEVDCACGLSVLASGQERLVHCSNADAETAWEHGEILGAPLVAGAAAAFEVVVVRRVLHGDHELFVGEVAGFSYVAGRTGLARYSGAVALPALAGG